MELQDAALINLKLKVKGGMVIAKWDNETWLLNLGHYYLHQFTLKKVFLNRQRVIFLLGEEEKNLDIFLFITIWLKAAPRAVKRVIVIRKWFKSPAPK
jgi:hypothetical protein